MALLTNVCGCEPPSELCDIILTKDNPQKLISLPRTITWFENQNPIDRGSIFKRNHMVSFSSSSKVWPSDRQTANSNLEIVAENFVMIEKLGNKSSVVSAAIISAELADDEETISISFPYGEG